MSYYPITIETSEAKKLDKALWFVIRNTARVTGLVSELPVSATTMSLYYAQITGTTSQLPRNLVSAYFYNFDNFLFIFHCNTMTIPIFAHDVCSYIVNIYGQNIWSTYIVKIYRRQYIVNIYRRQYIVDSISSTIYRQNISSTIYRQNISSTIYRQKSSW